MPLRKRDIKFYMVTAIAVTMFFSCKNNFKEVQKMGILQNEPISEAHNINLKYTDSGKITAILKSPKMLDFSNRDFPFSEFPDGVNLTLFDNKNNQNNIVADYAIVYSRTDLIDLQGNVVITTPAKDTIYADQLYYDQQNEWIFTNRPVRMVSGGNTSKGNILDTNRSFYPFQLMESSATIYVEEE